MKESKFNFEMDLKQMFYVLREKVLIIVMITLLCGVASYIYTEVCVTPTYSSQSSVYIVNRSDSDGKVASSSDLAAATSLTLDFERLLKSDTVMDEVIGNLDLNMNADRLKSMVSITNPVNTRSLEITATCTDPIQAKKIADEMAEVGAEQLVRIMEIDKVNIVDKGKVPTSPSSPNVKRNVAVCAALGCILACIWFLVRFFMDDTIKSATDVERYLNANVLASLPYREEVDTDKKTNKRKMFTKKKKSKHKSKSSARRKK